MNKMEGKKEQDKVSKEILWWLEFLKFNGYRYQFKLVNPIVVNK